MLDTILTIVITAGIPVAVFLLNWILRATKGYALSAAADFILAVVAFDFGGLMAGDIYRSAISSPEFQKDFTHIFGICFLVTLVLWASLFITLEYKVSEGYDHKARTYVSKTHKKFFYFSWLAVAPVLAAHFYIFLSHGGPAQ